MTTTTPGRTIQLCQIVAIAQGVKTRGDQALTRAYHAIQRPAPFTGISKTYRPKDEEGDQLPSEGTPIQARAVDLIVGVEAALERMFDVVATQDTANCSAKADLVVDGVVLLKNVPVTFLMWLEKQVVNLRTFVSKLPVLPLDETWTYDPNAKAFVTEPIVTTRTKKTPRNHQLAPATDKHPAQVEVYYEDAVVGYWSTTHFSGALPASQVFEIQGRIELVLDGIRFAREQANLVPITDVQAGRPVLTYIFGA